MYRKSLRLSSASKCFFSTGDIVNLQAIDSEKVFTFISWLHNLWSTPLLALASFFLLLKFTSLSALTGIAVLFTAVPFQAVLGALLSRAQRDLMQQKDSRAKLLSEALRSILTIKLFSWESKISSKIDAVRDKEISIMKKNMLMQATSSFVVFLFS